MRIAFAGTPEFARVALAALAEAGHEVALVLTQPDRPAGRGMKLQASPVKQEAQRRGIAVIQPHSLKPYGKWPDEARAAQQALAAARVDGLVVAAYGLILPRWTLELPPRGCLNIHASLLPRWRGAAPIQRCIEAGDMRTGITLMQMDEGLDTGPMLVAEGLDIAADETASTLHDRLAALGAAMVVRALPEWEAGRLVSVPQPADGVCHAAKIDKAEAAIDWTAPAVLIERRARAFDPFPGLVFALGADTVKLWRARVAEGAGAPGEVLRCDADGPVVACGEQALQLLELQRPGGRRQGGADFERAVALAPATRLSAG